MWNDEIQTPDKKEHLSEEEEAETIGVVTMTDTAQITIFAMMKSDSSIKKANNSAWCRPKKAR